jgi:hypothetical protein
MAQTQNARPRSHGCLWGCLAVLLVIFLPVVLAGSYGAWSLWQGFRGDPVMRTVSELVRRDGLAHQVLGDDVHIAGMDGNIFSYAPGLGSRSVYELRLSGRKGDGTLEVEADTNRGHVTVRSMTLTASGGGRYDLLHNVILTPAKGMESI